LTNNEVIAYPDTMIYNRHYILLDESPQEVFRLIAKMPNKFPVYSLL